MTDQSTLAAAGPIATTNGRVRPFRQEPRSRWVVWQAGLDGIYTIWQRDLLRFFRDRSRILGSLGQPVLFLFVFGSGLSSSIGPLSRGAVGLSYIQFMFPGVIVMGVLFTAISSAISIVWDREFGFLKEVLVAPVSRWAIVIGKALGGSTTAMLQGCIILALAPLAGVPLSVGEVILLLPIMFLTALALSSLGLVVAARMRTMEGFQVVMNFLMMPLFFLSGALFPLSNLPGWLLVLNRIDPASYGVDAIRKVLLTGAGLRQEDVAQLGLNILGQPASVALDI